MKSVKFVRAVLLLLMCLMLQATSYAIDSNKLDITQGSPAYSPHTFEVGGSTTANFNVSLSYTADQGNEQPALTVETQTYTADAGDGGVITSLSANGTSYTVPGDKQTFEFTITGGNNGSSFSAAVGATYSSYGYKTVVLKGNAKLSGDGGTVSGTSTGDAKATALKITMKADGVDITKPRTTFNKKIILGQKVKMSVSVEPAVAIDWVDWGFLSHVIKDYSGGKVIPLSSVERGSKEVTVAWIDQGVFEGAVTDVPVITRIDDEDFETIGAMTIFAPKLGSFKAWYTLLNPTARINIITDQRDNSQFLALQFGNNLTTLENTGIHYTGVVLWPAGFSGQTKVIQLIKPSRTASNAKGDKAVTTSTDFVLDDENRKAQDSDSPLDELQGTRVTVADKMEDYLMAQPTNGLWVSVGKLSWGWAADARRAGDNWTLFDISPTNPGGVTIGEAYTDFPVWTRDVYSIQEVITRTGTQP